MSKRHPGVIPELAVGMIAFREGYSATPTDRLDGYSTIGHGHLIGMRPVQNEDHLMIWVKKQKRPGRLTKAEARRLLIKDIRATAQGVRRLVKVPTNRKQFAVLISFAFNVGLYAFEDSTLLRKLNEGNYAAVPLELMRWVNGPSGPLPGLVIRRRREGKRFRPLRRPR